MRAERQLHAQVLPPDVSRARRDPRGARRDEAAQRAADAQAESVRLKEAYEAAAAAAKRLQDDALSLEIQAEAASVNALRCDATYPEREVREW